MVNSIGNHIYTAFRTGLILVGLLFLSCAKQGIPPGGPEDRRGPIILSTDPLPDSIGVPRDIRPIFQFDEYVDRASMEAATFISPFPEGKVRFKWRGKTVRLVFPEPLREDITYVITLGTGIRDLRGNALPWPFTLAFSTGDYLDMAAISGRIYGEGYLTGTQVWVYDLGVYDAPDPREINPDYVTQADDAGNYLLTHLHEGKYRIFAIDDRRRNRKWDTEEDRIGVAYMDVDAVQDFVGYGVNLRMTLRDTTGARITTVRVLDRNHLTLRFSEFVHPVDSLVQVSISDSAGVPLNITSVFPDPIDSLLWRVTTDTQPADHRYFLWVNGFLDNNKNPNLADSVEFEGIELPDTVGPHLLEFWPENMDRDIPDKPTIRLIFDEEITADSSTVSLLGEKSNPLAFDWHTDGPTLQITPQDSLEGSSIIAIVDLNTIRDAFDNPGADSSVSWRFTIVPRDTLGDIRGTVTDPVTGASGSIILKLDRLDLVRDSWHGRWEMAAPGDFVLPWLLPGEYRLGVFRDEDRSGDYSYGNPHPFSYAERFVIYPDTITVRSRWETAGVMVELPTRHSIILQPEIIDTTKVTP